MPADIEGNRHELKEPVFRSILKEGIAEALKESGGKPEDIKAVSYSSQANSFLLLDKDGEALTPIVMWPDTRVEAEDDATRRLWAPPYMEVTGTDLKGKSFYMAKIRWFMKNQPEIWAKTAYSMTISDYLTYLLSGERYGDGGTASLLGVLDLKNMKWWKEGLEIMEIPEKILSTPRVPGTVVGKVNKRGEEALGVPQGAAVAVGSLDHHVAAVGSGIGNVAEMSESTGTVLAALNYTDQYVPHSGCAMGPVGVDNLYYQVAFNNNGAGALEWYQKHYATDLSLEELNDAAASVPPGSDGLAILPMPQTYTDLEGFFTLPDFPNQGKAAGSGGSKEGEPSFTQGHYFRAMMEGIAANLKAHIRTLRGDNVPSRILATGGGARSDLWLTIKASLIGAEFVTTTSPEPACYGAGMYAAAAAGWFADFVEASTEWVGIRDRFGPERAIEKAYQEWESRYRKAIEVSS